MNCKIYAGAEIEFTTHPKFDGVNIGVLVTGQDTDSVSVCLLDIEKNTTIPVHIHDPQIDSIYVVSGSGEIHVNGAWQKISTGDYIFVPAEEEHGIRSGNGELRIFVHHSPPLL